MYSTTHSGESTTIQGEVFLRKFRQEARDINMVQFLIFVLLVAESVHSAKAMGIGRFARTFPCSEKDCPLSAKLTGCTKVPILNNTQVERIPTTNRSTTGHSNYEHLSGKQDILNTPTTIHTVQSTEAVLQINYTATGQGSDSRATTEHPISTTASGPHQMVFTNDMNEQAIRCPVNKLPNVTNGLFECPSPTNVSNGEMCTLLCAEGFYPPSSDQAICETGGASREGKWSGGNFICLPIGCDDWNKWGAGEYKVTNTRQAWDVSRQLCESDNGQLVTIDSNAENDFVFQVVKQCGSWHTSIGLNDLETEDTWQWSNHAEVAYTNWKEGQPAGGRRQNCVEILSSNGEWNDYNCSYPRSAFCKRN